MHRKYNNMTWPGFFCYIFDSLAKKKYYFLFVIVFFCLIYNYKTLISSYKDFKIIHNEMKASYFNREISNLKSAISEKNEHEQSLTWLYNLSNLENLPLIDHDYLLFKVDGSDHYTHHSIKDSKFIGVFDDDDDNVSIVPENNGYSIQLNNKNSQVCDFLLHGFDDLSSITVNANTVSMDEIKLKGKHDICHVSQINDIKFTFSK